MVVYNAHTGLVYRTIARPQVQAIAISPRNSFVVTFERLDQSLNEHKSNLIVWKLDDCSILTDFAQKNFIAENWYVCMSACSFYNLMTRNRPTIKWSDDEAYFGRTVTNEVHLFSRMIFNHY